MFSLFCEFTLFFSDEKPFVFLFVCLLITAHLHAYMFCSGANTWPAMRPRASPLGALGSRHGNSQHHSFLSLSSYLPHIHIHIHFHIHMGWDECGCRGREQVADMCV